MGMDLIPLAPSKDAPKHPSGEPMCPHYNWSGWSWLVDKLQEWGVDVSEFAGSNDGDTISEETCLRVADAIEAHLPEVSEEDREWIQPHIAMWRTSGGFEQW